MPLVARFCKINLRSFQKTCPKTLAGMLRGVACSYTHDAEVAGWDSDMLCSCPCTFSSGQADAMAYNQLTVPTVLQFLIPAMYAKDQGILASTINLEYYPRQKCPTCCIRKHTPKRTFGPHLALKSIYHPSKTLDPKFGA